MVHLQNRAIHVVAVLLHAAAQLADMVVGEAHSLLPESQLLVPLVGEQADIEVLLGKLHGPILAQIQNIQMPSGLRQAEALEGPWVKGSADGDLPAKNVGRISDDS